MAWLFETIGPAARNGTIVAVSASGTMVTRQGFFQSLSTEPALRRQLSATLTELDAEQIYWETPALATDTAHEPFEFAAIPTGLSRRPDSSAFREQLAETDMVATFANLGRDSLLVAPTDLGGPTQANYLLSFLRTAADDQIDRLWEAVGLAALDRFGDRPVWVSTSGGGVPWLHVRVDSRPKYYTHDPYRRPDWRRSTTG